MMKFMQAPHDQFERDAKLDGLGVAFFSILSAMLDEMADIHPDGLDALKRIQSVAVDMTISVSDHAVRDVGSLTGATIRAEALSAVDMVFAATRVGLGPSGDDVAPEV